MKKIPVDHKATVLSFLAEMTEESNAGCIKAQSPENKVKLPKLN